MDPTRMGHVAPEMADQRNQRLHLLELWTPTPPLLRQSSNMVMKVSQTPLLPHVLNLRASILEKISCHLVYLNYSRSLQRTRMQLPRQHHHPPLLLAQHHLHLHLHLHLILLLPLLRHHPNPHNNHHHLLLLFPLVFHLQQKLQDVPRPSGSPVGDNLIMLHYISPLFGQWLLHPSFFCDMFMSLFFGSSLLRILAF